MFEINSFWFLLIPVNEVNDRQMSKIKKFNFDFDFVIQGYPDNEVLLDFLSESGYKSELFEAEENYLSYKLISKTDTISLFLDKSTSNRLISVDAKFESVYNFINKIIIRFGDYHLRMIDQVVELDKIIEPKEFCDDKTFKAELIKYYRLNYINNIYFCRKH